MLKYYRMSLTDCREILYFEVGGIWYLLTQDDEIKRSSTQDMEPLVKAGLVLRAILTGRDNKLINDFVVRLVFHSPVKIEDW